MNYYQPKVAVKTGDVIGVETLVRWQHPTDGLIFPDRFISTAEKHGLINDLTSLVLTQAFSQARVWHEHGYLIRVAINVSMDNLASLSFQDLVGQRIQRIIRLVKSMEVRIEDLIISFGIKIQRHRENPDRSFEDLRKDVEDYKSELMGPQNDGDGLDQNQIDDLLATL